jgi:gentisate 1,2-dioxygenase
MVEGKGPFVCTDGSHLEFKTNDLETFNKHLLEHGYYGTAPCAVCDKPVRQLDKLVPNGKKPVCDDCKKEITG